MNYQLTPEAELDLRGIWLYTRATWGTEKANSYLKQLESGFERLCDHPEIGKRRDEVRSGYRSFAQKQHVIFYRDNEQQIEIIRVLHSRMDLEGRFG